MRKKIKVVIILCSVLCLAFGAKAQEEENAAKWEGNMSLGLSVTEGNTQTKNISFTFSAKGSLSDKIEWLNTGFFLFEQAHSITNSESMGFTSRINWNHSDRIFSFYEFQGLRDKFKNYDYRIFPTVGLGIKATRTEKTELSLNVGLSQVISKFTNRFNAETFTGATAGNQLTWNISPTAEFTQQLLLTADVSELKNFFARLEMSLSASISKKWALKLSVINTYDNNPSGAGIEKNDVAFIAGITYKF
jgi:putative salt-induced outer membrane protein YdiY